MKVSVENDVVHQSENNDCDDTERYSNEDEVGEIMMAMLRKDIVMKKIMIAMIRKDIVMKKIMIAMIRKDIVMKKIMIAMIRKDIEMKMKLVK